MMFDKQTKKLEEFNTKNDNKGPRVNRKLGSQIDRWCMQALGARAAWNFSLEANTQNLPYIAAIADEMFEICLQT
jgi:hypothetical protein